LRYASRQALIRGGVVARRQALAMRGVRRNACARANGIYEHVAVTARQRKTTICVAAHKAARQKMGTAASSEARYQRNS